MHDTAFDIGRQFFETYLAGRPSALILDIGAQNINGSLRECAPAGSKYIGIDLVPGDGVDIVLNERYSFPFASEHFDAVVSSSCFEHDQMFWLTFLEATRVIKTGGYIYINAPTNGNYHSHPYDNWRFYPDAGLALVEWARHNDQKLTLMESFIARRQGDVWNDCVMVFRKGPTPELPTAGRIVDRFPDSYNIRRCATEPPENMTVASEDMILLGEARAQLAARERQSGDVTARLGDLRNEVAAAMGRLAVIEHGAEQRLSGIDKSLQSIREDLGERNATFARLAEAVATARSSTDAELARLRAEATTRDGRLSALAESIETKIAADRAAAAAELMALAENLRLELQPLRAGVASAAAEIEALKEAVRTWLLPMLERHQAALRPGILRRAWRRAWRRAAGGFRGNVSARKPNASDSG